MNHTALNSQNILVSYGSPNKLAQSLRRGPTEIVSSQFQKSKVQNQCHWAQIRGLAELVLSEGGER